MPSKYPPDTIIYRTTKARASKILFLLSLMSSSTKSYGVPNINLSGESNIKTNLRKSRSKDVNLNIYKLSEFELHQVRSVLGSLPLSLINKGDTNPIIL